MDSEHPRHTRASREHREANPPALSRRAREPRSGGRELAACLLANPEGCSYADYQQYFNGQDACGEGKGGGKCRWTAQCEVEPSVQRLTPPELRDADQINERLGVAAAAKLARKLGMNEKMVLTPAEYQCLIGDPGQRTTDQDTIVACVHELTNSNGVVDISLSSYGLALDDPLRPDQSRDRSVCAPDAPCLRMNKVLVGPLEQLAAACNFSEKLARLFIKTPLLKFGIVGDACQSSSIADSGGACVAESIRRR